MASVLEHHRRTLGPALAAIGLFVPGLLTAGCSTDSERNGATSSGGTASLGGDQQGLAGALNLGGADGDASRETIWAEGLAKGVNYGIARAYPFDDGIGENPWVYDSENFESGSAQIPIEEDRLAGNVTVVDENAFQGTYSARMEWPEDLNGPTTRYQLPQSLDDNPTGAYFVRVCYDFDESFHPGGDASAGVGVKGFGIVAEREGADTGLDDPCDGTNWFNAQVQFVGWGPSQKLDANDGYLWVGHLYSYNHDPEGAVATYGQDVGVSDPAAGSEPYRFSSYADPFRYLHFNEWACYEVGLYLNTPGENDGEARFWIDGVLQSRVENMRYRDLEDFLPTDAHINLHRTTEGFPQTMVRWMDNIVISRRYIGPPVTE